MPRVAWSGEWNVEPKATYGRLFGIWWTGGRPDRCLHCDWNDGGNKRMQEGSFVERSMRNSQRWFNSRKEEQHYGAKQYSTGALPKKKLRSRQDILLTKTFLLFQWLTITNTTFDQKASRTITSTIVSNIDDQRIVESRESSILRFSLGAPLGEGKARTIEQNANYKFYW